MCVCCSPVDCNSKNATEVERADMDEDDYARLIQEGSRKCPFWRNGDEYAVVRKQI